MNHLFTKDKNDQSLNVKPVNDCNALKMLCDACRRGDVRAVQEIIQSSDINLNAVDEFDYSPLTLVSSLALRLTLFVPVTLGVEASLCGHYDVVQLLLESGALCVRSTFQGERCLYAALTEDIRDLLLQYDFSKSVDERQPFALHLSSLLSLTPLDTSDINVSVAIQSEALLGTAGTPTYMKEFRLHRFILCARSKYFAQRLLPSEGRKSSKILQLPNSIDPKATEITFRFLYLGEIAQILSGDLLAHIKVIYTLLDLPSLWYFALTSDDPKSWRQVQSNEIDKAKQDLDTWFDEFVLGKAVRVNTDEADAFRMEVENDSFADVVLRSGEDAGNRPPGAAPDWKPQTVFYPVHKAMLRSEFFTLMFTSSFKEGQKQSPDEPLHIISLEILPHILELVLRFLYSDKVVVPLEYALDTLYAADQLFIERLKVKVTMIISSQGHGGLPGDYGNKGENWDNRSAEGYDVYDVIRAGWATRQQKLEEFGAKYITARLEEYLDDPEFAEIVQESADRITFRQETDTIELIDDIRHFLDKRFRMRTYDMGFGEEYEELNHSRGSIEKETGADIGRDEALKYEELLGKINSLLEQLGLDA